MVKPPAPTLQQLKKKTAENRMEDSSIELVAESNASLDRERAVLDDKPQTSHGASIAKRPMQSNFFFHL